MIDIFLEQRIAAACMFSCLFLSIFLKIFLGALYRHMIKEADNMAITNNKLLKQCKMKFSNCYELNNGIHNIPVFVDKFISRLSLGHLSFDLIYHLSGQMMLLSVVAAGVGVSRSILDGRTLGEVLPYYIASFLGLYLYFSVSTVADIKGKRRMLKINLVDYLENHLSSRMSVTKRDLEMLYGEAMFQEKTQGGEWLCIEAGNSGQKRGKKGGRNKAGNSGEQIGRGKGGKKMVEVMPVGGRLTAGRAMTEGTPQEMAQESAQEAVSGIAEVQEMTQPGRAGIREMAQPGRAGIQEMAQPGRAGIQGMPMPGMAGVQGAAALTGATPLSGTAGQQAPGDVAVTEEELEMLLKEFLTG